ncbi:MAG: polyamine aminopropyltransferase [Sandaracinaceae bacterium]|nr:polyamine aminopropyltransferase [Sandaracinaceae bacterium]
MDGSWHHEVFRGQASFGLRVTEVLHEAQSAFQRIEVLDTPMLGTVLVLDGIFQTAERDERSYHEMIVHPALCSAPSIERVLVIGGGDGGTAREVLRHPGVKRCVMIEVDREVVEVCQRHLPTLGAGVWDDPRLDLRFGDGVAFVAETTERFDVVILDGSDPVGPSRGLFGKRFYENVRRVLGDTGVFALQSESPTVDEALFFDIQGALRDVFDHARPYFGAVYLYSAGLWTWTLASAVSLPEGPRPERLAPIAPGCDFYDADVHRAAFVAPPFVRRRLKS